MSRFDISPLCFDYMGDFGDDDHRPAKRLRFDEAAAGQGAPPPDVHEDEIWGMSQTSNPEWHFSNSILAPDPFTISMPGSLNGIVPEQIVTMPMSSPTASGFPLDTMVPPWGTRFNIGPSPSDISSTFPPPPLRHVRLPMEESQPLRPSLQHQLPLHSQISLQSQPLPPVQPLPRSQLPPQPRQTQPPRSPLLIPELIHQGPRRRKFRPKHVITSPFTDCIDSFGNHFSLQQFPRPKDGTVNGYVKFSWPRSTRQDRQPSRIVDVTDLDNDDDSPTPVAETHSSRQVPELVHHHHCSASLSASTGALPLGSDSPFSTASTLVSSQNLTCLHSPTESAAPYVNMNWENPRYVPSSFGLDAKMDSMDRKLFKFYVQNWCPGRSVLKKTNLWLTDFARLHNQEGVRAAIHSLAGVYIHDYLPNDSVRRRVNERFRIAEDRLSHLLQSPHRLSDDESSELVTLVSLLSMQDIVLTERRLKKPYHPRWLTGFKQAENILQLTDPGNRFYKKSNVQVDTLRLSQSVIVGRAVILAQPMMPHPPIATFDPAAETARFGFLLYGSEQEIYEIHGGCGFSKRLLHIFSQVTYCSARMLQEPETPIVPITAKMLYDQLLTLKQWSGEWDSWEAAQERTQQPIDWIRQKGETYVTNEAGEMTEVTAEAWRLAGMVYLQCRLFRLPRNHPEVVVNLADLAKTISIMPTSGLVFTAQAPLLPVFVLGLLATVEDHVQVAHDWFQQVIYTPVRSSVPPLYDALVRIQSWIDIEIPVPASCMELPRTIAERQPWWEHMVSKVQEKEVEVLCLT
ncbi:hypothetical protein MY3296_005110 [Beauveria thailandica]